MVVHGSSCLLFVDVAAAHKTQEAWVSYTPQQLIQLSRLIPIDMNNFDRMRTIALILGSFDLSPVRLMETIARNLGKWFVFVSVSRLATEVACLVPGAESTTSKLHGFSPIRRRLIPSVLELQTRAKWPQFGDSFCSL